MTKCHAVPAKTIKLSYGSGPLRPPAFFAFPAHGEGGPLAVDEVFSMTGYRRPHQSLRDSFPMRGEALRLLCLRFP